MSFLLGLVLTGTNKKVKNVVLDITYSIEGFADLVRIGDKVDELVAKYKSVVVAAGFRVESCLGLAGAAESKDGRYPGFAENGLVF